MNKVKLMGILNVTPDSFSDGGRFLLVQEAVNHALAMQVEGADLIDIGGESTRPGADPVDAAEEIARVLPVIEALKSKLTIPISIDTIKPKVAEAALAAGAIFLNDVTGFRDLCMIEVAAKYQPTICCMHMLGTPRTMQQNPHYEKGVVYAILEWAEKKIEELLAAGILPEKIILDPGIGFGKTVADNLEILHNLPRLRRLGFPLLIGASRKSFMTRILNKPPCDLGAATLAAHTAAVLGGADYIRAHDVAWHRDVLDVALRLRESKTYE